MAVTTLFRDGDRGPGATGRHVDIVRFDDQPGSRVVLRLRHDFEKFRIVMGSGETLVALFLRGISAYVDKSVLGADAEFGIALARNPVADVGNAVAGVDGGGAVGEPGRERVTLAGQRGIDTEFVKADGASFAQRSPRGFRRSRKRSPGTLISSTSTCCPPCTGWRPFYQRRDSKKRSHGHTA